MNDTDSLRAHAERIRSSGVLGRSQLMQRLFDFLLECSLAGRTPKEVEVAIEVFGKSAAFEVSQNAMVRVYVHKLRRKLADFYAGVGAQESLRIAIPKGEYRYALEGPPASETRSAGHRSGAPQPAIHKWLLGALAVSVLLNGVALVLAYPRLRAAPDELNGIRHGPVWSRLVDDDRTIFVVLGDYYIFGETDESMEVKRLVREFSINSPDDLAEYQKRHPGVADNYLDLQLAYLPTAAAYALRDVMPVLATANKRVRVVMASDLSPAIVKSADVVYIGYISGLGMLRDSVFAGSRFSVGDSYDEIVDRQSGHRYVSQAAVPLRGAAEYHDYGYFATFAGPSGNQIVIIAGTRDVAVMHTAEALTNRKSLDLLSSRAAGAQNFEALYDVYGMDNVNLDGKLLVTSALDTRKIWAQ